MHISCRAIIWLCRPSDFSPAIAHLVVFAATAQANDIIQAMAYLEAHQNEPGCDELRQLHVSLNIVMSVEQ